MLLKLSEHITNCLERAANAEARALQSTDPSIRSDNELLAQSWRHLACSYQFVESLEQFLAGTNRDKADALPRETPADVHEQPEAPGSKPIVPRRRVKHDLSFKDRLLKSAQEAREQAAKLPAGPARDNLLMKARQSETAATFDNWSSTPGSPPPGNRELTKKPGA